MSKQIAGTYKIINKVNGHFYYGSSVDIKNRWKEHRRTLNNGSHHNEHLQNAWEKYGGHKFEFVIACEVVEPEHAVYIEDYVLRHVDCVYNIAPRATVVAHSEETKQKISNSLMGKNNPNYGKDFSGKNNPRYGKKHSEETKKKISESNRKNHADFSGKNNPMYGIKNSKYWTPEKRKAQSERIKKYWAKRKANESTKIQES